MMIRLRAMPVLLLLAASSASAQLPGDPSLDPLTNGAPVIGGDTPDPAPPAEQPERSEPPPETAAPENRGAAETFFGSSGSRHSESHSSSSSVDVSVGVAPASDDRYAPPPPPPGRPAVDDDVARWTGDWKLSSADRGTSCNVTLKSGKTGDLYDTWIRTGCPEGFFDATKWRPTRSGLQIVTLFGEVRGDFRGRRGRLDGIATKTGAPVTLSR